MRLIRFLAFSRPHWMFSVVEFVLLCCILGPLANAMSEILSGGRLRFTQLVFSTAAHVILVSLVYLARGYIQHTMVFSWAGWATKTLTEFSCRRVN